MQVGKGSKGLSDLFEHVVDVHGQVNFFVESKSSKYSNET